MREPSEVAKRIGVGTAAVVIQLAPGVAVWGGWRRFACHPARRRLAALSLAAAAGAAANGLNVSRGRRDVAQQRLAAVLIFGGIVAGRFLSPLSDRHSILVFHHDGVRTTGLALYALGALLFEWSRAVLGRHYSFMAAIQQDHELVRAGPYRLVRHPGYIGLLLWQTGYALVFRSALGVVLVVPVAAALAWRVADEEALLHSEFGDEFEEYRARTSQFVPYVH
jgi:protein-S-isoprenylcysteine O-methyltransferase Ste14